MQDLYIGNLLEGEIYEYWDSRMCYIDKIDTHYVKVYECERANPKSEWAWNLRTPKYLRRHIRTILDMED